MADGVTFSIIGLDPLLAKLDGLKSETKLRGGRFALRKAAQLIRDAARENAKRLDDSATPEDIAANITERWNGRRFKRTGDLGFRVGVQGGARQIEGSGAPGGDTFYWRFLEFGTEHIAARPFMRPALANNINAATDVFVREFNKAIDRAIKRAAKSGGAA